MADNRLIPAGIRDTSTLALNDLIDRMGTVDLTPLLVYLIDNVAASALPHLAEQFNVTGYEGWLQTTNTAERRALIKTAIAKHYYKGTPYAIKQAIADVGLAAVIIEWFDYAGTPYHFKVEVTTNGAEVDAAKTDIIEKLIFEYKNVRSVLDVLSFIIGVTGKVPVYNTGAIYHESTVIYG